MHWYIKDMKSIGFKGSNIFESRWHHFYYREVPKKKAVYILDALSERVQHFELTKQEWGKFKRGTLSLIPVGCCDAGCSHCSHCSHSVPIVDFEGNIRKVFGTKKNFLKYLDELCTKGQD